MTRIEHFAVFGNDLARLKDFYVDVLGLRVIVDNSQAPVRGYFLADDRGYFKAEGLEVQMDQGNGSGAAVPLVANGTYDVGFGDINALIELAARKPDEAPIAVYVMYNRPPFTVAVKADSPIKEPKDLAGKKIGLVNMASPGMFFAKSVAKTGGVSQDALTFVPVNVGAQPLAALESKQIDVLSFWDRGEWPSRRTGTGEIMEW